MSSTNFSFGFPSKSYAPDLTLEPIHTDISVRVDILNDKADLEVIHTILCNNSNSNSINLNGVGLLNLRVVGLGDHSVEWFYDGELIQIRWNNEFIDGEKRAVKLTYSVCKPVAGMLFSHPDKFYPNKETIVATDHETEMARYWLACVDYPSVRAKVDFHIYTPSSEGYTSVANGLCVGKVKDGSWDVTHWKLDYPCPSYLICFGAGNLHEVLEKRPSKNGIEIKYLAPTNVKKEDIVTSFAETPDIMDWLEDKLGIEYPFKNVKYYQLVHPLTNSGAMENISLTTWDFSYIIDKYSVDRKLRTDLINLHEMTHSYFGDSVVCRHFEHSWLKESWASYMETVWCTDYYGNDEGSYLLYCKKKDYIEETKSYVRPIVEQSYNTSWNLFDRHLYPGGAWRIHQLRRMIKNDKKFWSAVKDYLLSNACQTVETTEFRQKLEKHTSMNLTKYFDQWILSCGYPVVTCDFDYDISKNEVTMVFNQVQKDEQRKIGLFDFNLDVHILDSNNKLYKKTVKFENSETTTLKLELHANPISIEVDPNNEVLFELKSFRPSTDILKYVLKNSQSLFHRILAGQELIKIGGTSNLDFVYQAIKEEKFHGVKSELSSALAVSTITGTDGYVIDLLGSLVQPEPLRSLLDTIRSNPLRSNGQRERIIELLKRDDLTYKVRSSALRTLGSFAIESDCDILIDHIKQYSNVGYIPIVVDGALRGLGLNRSKRAYQYLLSVVEYGKLPVLSRPVALKCIPSLVRWVDIPNVNVLTKEFIIKFIEERDELVILGCIDALTQLKAKEYVTYIESSKSKLPHQSQVKVERYLLKLKSKSS
eukprot:TRINITY_DN1482_c0_g1_i2.p1 TRINITY_DN1482_c0_g1~~TRINITY_DN1482_c0_g1_i2.p1  ORF type:complete len:821 (-),score=148.15 TRINITY_DN1482_c0_g1_i2:74-2536(-)